MATRPSTSQRLYRWFIKPVSIKTGLLLWLKMVGAAFGLLLLLEWTNLALDFINVAQSFYVGAAMLTLPLFLVTVAIARLMGRLEDRQNETLGH